jgi:hypothetical protein
MQEKKKTKGTDQRLFAARSYPIPLSRFITFDPNIGISKN